MGVAQSSDLVEDPGGFHVDGSGIPSIQRHSGFSASHFMNIVGGPVTKNNAGDEHSAAIKNVSAPRLAGGGPLTDQTDNDPLKPRADSAQQLLPTQTNSQQNNNQNALSKVGGGGGVWGLGPALVVSGSSPLDIDSCGNAFDGEATSANAEEDKLIPCVFTWTNGGHNVYLVGTFNQWKVESKVRLVRIGHEFTVVKELPRDRHYYKFIVDEVWRFAADQPTVTDENGNVNNILDTTGHKTYNFQTVSELETARTATYSQFIAPLADYTTDAPPLPLLFSKTICPAADPPPRMAAPLHAIANHAYHDALGPTVFGAHVSVMACTHRWRPSSFMPSFSGQKYSIVVFVTLNPLFLASTITTNSTNTGGRQRNAPEEECVSGTTSGTTAGTGNDASNNGDKSSLPQSSSRSSTVTASATTPGGANEAFHANLQLSFPEMFEQQATTVTTTQRK